MTEAAGLQPSQPGALTHRRVLKIALPIVLSNATVPLLGAVDTGVIGHLGRAAPIGAVGVGSVILATFYWVFGFLRMGTSGLTSQAYGAGDTVEVAATLERALLIGFGLGVVLLVLQVPIGVGSIALMGGSQEVQKAARLYYDVRIWSAPFALMNYALLGWFIGLGRAGRAFLLQLLLNSVNIVLAVVLVLDLHLGVAGAGTATLVAECLAAGVGLGLAWHELRLRGGRADRTQVLRPAALKRLLAINADIMVRTVCLLLAFAFFTAQSARTGDVTLAANGLLFSLFGVAAYFLDGFAHAAEIYVGQSIGARRRDRLMEAIRLSSLWSGGLSLLGSAGLWLLGGPLVGLLTTSPEVQAAVRQYLPWCAMTPLLGFVAFQLDGIFIGATRGRDMRNMMLVSLAVFFAAWAVLMPAFGTHGLWAALLVFFAARAVTLGMRLPVLIREAFEPG